MLERNGDVRTGLVHSKKRIPRFVASVKGHADGWTRPRAPKEFPETTDQNPCWCFHSDIPKQHNVADLVLAGKMQIPALMRQNGRSLGCFRLIEIHQGRRDKIPRVII